MATTEEGGAASAGEGEGRRFCSLHAAPKRILPASVTPMRERLINLFGNKWVSGTILHYYFFDRDTDGENVLLENGHTVFVPWKGAENEMQVVRQAFDVWAQQGIGIRFEEVREREEAEIRIGFMRGDGAWSWLGREILDHGPNERTMNFGWNISAPGELDTAIHEIGHTLGFPHEHQNPKSGIEWDEEAVYLDLARPPNEWDRAKTYWNIIRKLEPGEVEGTTWDPDSVMHYPFKKGLIRSRSSTSSMACSPREDCRTGTAAGCRPCIRRPTMRPRPCCAPRSRSWSSWRRASSAISASRRKRHASTSSVPSAARTR